MTWIDDREAQDPEKVRRTLAEYESKREQIRVAQYDNGDPRFGLWLYLVDRHVVRRIGLGLFDLADWPMHDAYEAGTSPSDAAQQALESDDLYASFVGGEGE